MRLRPATDADHDAIWAILEPVIRAGETYALPRNWTRHEALDYWFKPPHQVFVVQKAGSILGTYFLQPNQMGGGAHIANCGFMTRADAGGQGVGSAMAEHALITAKAQGFSGMQFNFVVSANETAIHLWHRLGFEALARLPRAFAHPHLGLVDAHVMFKPL
jgi:ribosomal protein S18 acetylase RimI-like enzyme